MNGHTIRLTLFIGTILLTGCDSSYHAFDGKSGFEFQPLPQHRYELTYHGSAKDDPDRVKVMWQHTAREICRGSAYLYENTLSSQPIDELETELNAFGKTQHTVHGRLACLTPNYANRAHDNSLFSEHFATNEFKSGRATH